MKSSGNVSNTELTARRSFSSLKSIVVFTWISFVVLQQVQRLFLLKDAWTIEPPTSTLLAKTLATGLLADLLTAGLGILLAGVLAGAGILCAKVVAPRTRRPRTGNGYRKAFIAASVFVGILFVVLLTADTIYYSHSQQRLDFVFFEYLDELFGATSQAGQAAEQTRVGASDSEKWLGRLLAFLLLEAAACVAWWKLYSLKIAPALIRWETALPVPSRMLIVAGLAASMTGFHPQGPYAIKGMEIANSVYDTLAQNTVLFAREPLRAAILSRWSWWASSSTLGLMAAGDAIKEAQRALGAQSVFPYSDYPLIRKSESSSGIRFPQQVNVVMIFVEGLDRRYLGRTVQAPLA